MKKIFAFFVCTALVLSALFSCTPPIEKDAVAFSSESFEISRGEMAYFFVKTMRSTLSSYSKAELEELGYSADKPLKKQSFKGGKSFYDVFLASTEKYVRELLILCEAAKQSGVGIDESDGLERKLAEFKAECEKAYGVAFEKYIDTYFYSLVSEKDFCRAVELEMLANKYLKLKTEEIYGGITPERIEKYISESKIEENSEKTKTVMTLFVSSKNHTDAAAYAASLLEGFAPTREGFASLAKEHSDNTEFLFENCQKGELASEIDAWLFDSERKLGDIEILNVNGGALIVYFCEDGLSVSDLAASRALAASDYARWLDCQSELFPIITKEEVLYSLDI